MSIPHYDKLNLRDLYKSRHLQDERRIAVFYEILAKVHSRIRHIANTRWEQQCSFEVPEMIPGQPRYDMRKLAAFLIQKLRENEFNVVFYPPHTLHISWEHLEQKHCHTQYAQIPSLDLLLPNAQEQSSQPLALTGPMPTATTATELALPTIKKKQRKDTTEFLPRALQRHLKKNERLMATSDAPANKEIFIRKTDEYKPSRNLLYDDSLMDKFSKQLNFKKP